MDFFHFIDGSHPTNRLPLRALEARGPEARPLTPASEAGDPYYEAGCHPDIVAFMWERLAKEFPVDARCLVYGTPCIVQPKSGILLAAGMGTSYVLRLLPESLAQAATFGCTPLHTWGGSTGTTDLRNEYGDDWVFGSFGPESIEWCRAAFHHLNAPPAADTIRITATTPARSAGVSGRLQLLIGQEPNLEPRVQAVDPDAKQIEDVVSALDWSRFTIVVIRRDETHSLEISGSLKPEDGLSGRADEDGVELITVRPPTISEAVRLLQSYASSDSSWKALVEWE
jgi:hypothetical protein